MVGLLADSARMRTVLSVEAWFVISTLRAPIGYMLQDCVANAMTAEAVRRVDAYGPAGFRGATEAWTHTMQTLGRVAIIGGTVVVALANVILFCGEQYQFCGIDVEAADKYVNQIFVVTRAVRDPVTNVVQMPADTAIWDIGSSR